MAKIDPQSLVLPQQTLRDAVNSLERTGLGIALVVAEEDQKLIGVITDGDIRRCFARQLSLETDIQNFLNNFQERTSHRQPFTLPENSDNLVISQQMRDLRLSHIPLTNEMGQPAALILRGEIVKQEEPPLRAVVMAGGRGIRLDSLTQTTPKPMLHVGDTPLLERIITQLSDAGVRDIAISVHYKKEQIIRHFVNGEKWGVRIHYLHETFPRGTAGCLSQVSPYGSPILLLNGDILTNINFNEMYNFHHQHNAKITVGITTFEQTVPYGVVEIDGIDVGALTEKPTKRHFISSGIYIIDPSLCALIPDDRKFDITDLIQMMLERGERVIAFHMHEYWNDIGRIEDYDKANADVINLATHKGYAA